MTTARPVVQRADKAPLTLADLAELLDLAKHAGLPMDRELTARTRVRGSRLIRLEVVA